MSDETVVIEANHMLFLDTGRINAFLKHMGDVIECLSHLVHTDL